MDNKNNNNVGSELCDFKGFSKNAIRILNVPTNSGNSKMAMSHYTAMADMYNSETNPNGFISLHMAENLLSFDLLKDKLKEDPNFNQSLTQYAEAGGIKKFKESIAVNLLQNKLFKFKPTNEKYLVKPEQIVTANGAAPILENMFNLFCNEGDYAIIPSPLFGSFIPFAGQRFGAKILSVPSEIYNESTNQIIDFQINFKEFDRLYNENKSTIKMVVLCNPNNPNGYIFSKKQLSELVDWCRLKKVHLISDEIYAFSLFGKQDDDNEIQSVPSNSFSSIYDICKGDMGEYIHLVSSFSKDFAMNGYRAGYLFSQNQRVLKYILTMSPYYSCSNSVQSTISNILNDTDFLNSYISTNQKRLLDAYTFASNTLKSFNIPFIKSSSGLFISIDLRKCLPLIKLDDDNTNNCTWAKEFKLWELMFDHRVVITCGRPCLFSQPGYFRIVFTLSNDVVYNGIKRISDIYNNILSNK